MNTTGTTYLETAMYTCNTGYEQTGGNLTRTCQDDGNWDGTEIICTIKGMTLYKYQFTFKLT